MAREVKEYKFFAMILAMMMLCLAVLGGLIGLLFGKALICAGIGAMIPIVWCAFAWCAFKVFELLTKGQWG
jgi:hypothetical protein